MGTLCPGKDYLLAVRLGSSDLLKRHLNALVAQELHAGMAMFSATPVSPEQGGRSHLQGMQQQTDPTRLHGRRPMPLTLLPQPTASTVF